MEDQLLDEDFNNHPANWNPTQDEKTLGLLSHIGTLAGGVIPFGNVLLPLVLWLTQKEKSDFVAYHSKESLNFQITMTIGYIISAILILAVVGIFLLIGLALFALVVTIIATVKASNGEAYEYPINLRLVK
jgi:hypothetical protein